MLSLIFPMVAVTRSHRRQGMAVAALGHDGRGHPRAGRRLLDASLLTRATDLTDPTLWSDNSIVPTTRTTRLVTYVKLPVSEEGPT